MRLNGLVQKRSKFKKNCAFALTQLLSYRTGSETVKKSILEWACVISRWPIRESLQMWPGLFPHFWVGPGDEASEQKNSLGMRLFPITSRLLHWCLSLMSLSELHVNIWILCHRLSFISTSGLSCWCLGFQTLMSEWCWSLIRTACHIPKPHLLMWQVYGANYWTVLIIER